MKYCCKEDDVFYHMVMVNTKTKTNTKTKSKKKTKCFQDPMYAIFLFKSRGCKDLKYFLAVFFWWQRQRQGQRQSQRHRQRLRQEQDKDKHTFLLIFRGEYFSGVNIFQGNMLRKTRRNQICFSQIETGPKGRRRPGLVTRIRRCGCGCYYSSNRKVCGRIEYECSSVYGTRGPLSV